jgi:hypothetical protein
LCKLFVVWWKLCAQDDKGLFRAFFYLTSKREWESFMYTLWAFIFGSYLKFPSTYVHEISCVCVYVCLAIMGEQAKWMDTSSRRWNTIFLILKWHESECRWLRMLMYGFNIILFRWIDTWEKEWAGQRTNLYSQSGDFRWNYMRNALS